MQAIRVLLCAEQKDDWLLARAFLDPDAYELDCVGTFQEAEHALSGGEYHAYLIDDRLGGGRGVSLALAAARTSKRPILVLSTAENASTERHAIAQGVADVLLRREISPHWLDKSIRFAITRSRRSSMSITLGTVEQAMLNARLDSAVQRARRGLGGVAVLNVGVLWSDDEGHSVSNADVPWDAAIERVRASLHDIDTVTRTNDGFVVLIEDQDPKLRAARAADGILREMRESFASRRGSFKSRACVGAAVFPDDGGTSELLTSGARDSLARARAIGSGEMQFAALQSDDRLARRIFLERAINTALEQGDFHVVYQPQLEIETGRLTGAEALLRWNHPQFGLVSPVEFIPILESSDLIAKVGAWVLAQAARQAKAWLDDEQIDVCISVNVSAQQFGLSSVKDDVERALTESGAPARLLGVELTESVMLDATSGVRETLTAIRDLGVHVAVDDFGTGYASLRYVKHFPMDVIKIDREFVRGLPLDTHNAGITNSIVALAHSLQLSVVAEGVENAAEEEFLRSLHCNTVQGFLHAKPLSPTDFVAWAKAHRVH